MGPATSQCSAPCRVKPVTTPTRTPTRSVFRACWRTKCLVAPYNDTEFALQVIEEYADELAGIIIEPLQRVLRPVPGFLEAVREKRATDTGSS